MKRKISKALRHPREAFRVLCALSRGFFYRGKFKVLRQQVVIGRNFRVRKTLRVRGPGTVHIGDDVSVDGTSRPVTPCTYSPDARISIGSGTFLNGTRFGCRRAISIGARSIIGDASLADTDFHHVDPRKRHSNEPPPAEPIVVGENVWIGGASIILKGVTIGRNSVVGAGAVVTRDVPENCLALGNPAAVVKKI